MKKILSVLVSSLMAMTMLAGCGSKPSEESGKPVLRVGTEIGYPPMEYFDEDGATPIGYDIEVAHALGEELGMEVEIIDTAWDGIFAGVETDKYDVIISCVSWTEERDAAYNLSNTYVANAPVLVVPKDSDIADIKDLKDKKVAVQMETTADYIIQDYNKDGLGTNLVTYEKVINCFDDIKAGRVDAVCTDSVVASYYLGDEASNYMTVWQADTAEPICMCMKKGNDELTKKINDALQALIDNGKLTEIGQKYFGYDVTENL